VRLPGARSGSGQARRHGRPEAKVRLRIKRLLRKHRTFIPTEGGGLDAVADRVFQQARVLYQRWPEIEGEAWL